MKVLEGYKPLCFIGGFLLLSRGFQLFLYNVNNESLQFLTALDSSLHQRLATRSKLLTRLLRSGVQYAVAISDTEALLAINKSLVSLNIETGRLHTELPLRQGRRPLSICKIEGISHFTEGHYFGEYFENNEKAPINIYRRKLDGQWEIAFTFKQGEIDHVHAIVPDPYNDHVWILTGDFDNGAAIWVAKNNFQTVTRAVSGEQKYRGSVAFPTTSGLLYATDSQFEPNTIRILAQTDVSADSKKENGWVSTALHQINGPCIYSSEGSDGYYFSNSVEPGGMLSGNRIKDIAADIFVKKLGAGNISPETVIVRVNSQLEIEEISRSTKDRYPMALFQFGNTQFPSGLQPAGKLITYNVALREHDQDTIIRNITS